MDFPNRHAEDLSFPEAQLRGQGQAMLPAILHREIPVGALRVRHPGPANEDPSSVLRLKGLRRVEIKAHIPLPEGILGIFIIIQERIPGLINILELFLLGFQPLGAEG